MNDLRQEFLAFALQLAEAAEAEILPLYRNVTVSRKADGSEVTEADRKAEAAIRQLIAERYPEHGIIGEEFGTSESAARHQWVIDPVDGTAWFTLGVPLFGTLVALLEDGEPVVGVVHLPVQGETVYAAQGSGCWFRTRTEKRRRVTVSPAVPLPEAAISASGIHASDIKPTGDKSYRLTSVIRQAGKFRFCGDCSQHALVCRGNLHVAIDPVMAPWDIAALVPCVEEAGGVATSIHGERASIIYSGSLITSCDRALHEEVLNLLNS